RACDEPEGSRCGITVSGPTYATAVFPPPQIPETEMTSPAPGVSSTLTLFAQWRSPGAREGSTYDLRYRVAHARGALHDFPTTPQHIGLSTTTWAIAPRFGSTYCFEARTVDVTDLAGPWSGERCTTVPLDDRSLRGSRGGWWRLLDSRSFAGTTTWTTDRGATLRATGLRATGLSLL